jgi:hypothetical protein
VHKPCDAHLLPGVACNKRAQSFPLSGNCRISWATHSCRLPLRTAEAGASAISSSTKERPSMGALHLKTSAASFPAWKQPVRGPLLRVH